jgi:glycosyltransferase involved in cell wall biosynthesis
MVSVIIPTYNSSQTIKACLDSVLLQTFTDFEVLVMDGLSTDNTVELVKAYNDSRIRICSEKDAGVYDAMNKGVDKATGEWLYFLGSDDCLYDKEVLRKISKHILEAKGKNIRIVYGNVLIDGATAWAKDKQIYDGYYSLNKLLAQNISHQAMFYHCSVFENLRYNTDYKICADWNIAICCFSRYRFCYMDEIVAIFKAGGYSSFCVDYVFKKERWRNAADSYGIKILKKDFWVYYSDIYNSFSFFSKYFIIKLFYFSYKEYRWIKSKIRRIFVS